LFPYQLKLESDSKDAFKNAGKEAGLFIWRVEKNTVVPWPKELTGTFYSAHDYVVLRSHKSDKGLLYVLWRQGIPAPIGSARMHSPAPRFTIASWPFGRTATTFTSGLAVTRRRTTTLPRSSA